MTVLRIDHVQLAMPRGGEADARRFYGELLGLHETPKPPDLAARGGAWFELGDVQVHLGVDTEFRPAKKAHVGFVVGALDELVARLRAAGHDPRIADPLSGRHRAFVEDPFGNRVELIEADRPSAS
ncbi:MAG TPA: VOC family protein [Steroidobacteraceae bacterium]|nr:VOC family protein [Steroidobacteraceae bacterium]